MTVPRALLLALLLALPATFAVAEEDPAPAPAPAEPPAPEQPAAPETPSFPEGPATPPRGSAREMMWPAADAAGWAMPVLLRFQRTWDDAVAVSRETGKPILVCINMDGEIASEHYAGVRYRQPEIAELYKPYVCVIASVYRHNPRDHDDEGNRIPCPRFGSVTCGEHIAIEPVIYEKFCDGQRIAPRHIMVDLEGKEVYDVFYANDTASVFDTIRQGPTHVAPPRAPIVRGDRPVLERVASRHVEDRTAVEAAYRAADKEMKRKLLQAAIEHSDVAQLDLLRMAIFGLDVDLSRAAREALARLETVSATELISESLQVPMDEDERTALIDTLERLGDDSRLALWLAGVHRGLAAQPSTVDPSAWREATPAAPETTPDAGVLTARAEYQAAAAETRPDDPVPRLELAEANLALALEAPRTWVANQRMARMVSRQLFADALEAVDRAEALGATGWRVHMVRALASYYSGDLDTAYARAASAMAELPPGDASWNSMALVTIYAESLWKKIKAAVAAKERWPAEWLADLHAAYAILQQHPLGTDGQVTWHYEFLVWLGAEHRASRVLQEGLERWPDSPALHERLRQRLMKRRGADAIESTYDRMLAERPDAPALWWFAGEASTMIADQYRRGGRRDGALEAYGRAVERYGKVVELEPIFAPAARERIGLIHGSRARVAFELGQTEMCLVEVLKSFEVAPNAAGTRDGMGITPGETAQMLLAHLRADDRMELAETLEAALAELDPELLRFDRE